MVWNHGNFSSLIIVNCQITKSQGEVWKGESDSRLHESWTSFSPVRGNFSTINFTAMLISSMEFYVGLNFTELLIGISVAFEEENTLASTLVLLKKLFNTKDSDIVSEVLCSLISNMSSVLHSALDERSKLKAVMLLFKVPCIIIKWDQIMQSFEDAIFCRRAAHLTFANSSLCRSASEVVSLVRISLKQSKIQSTSATLVNFEVWLDYVDWNHFSLT